MTALSASWENTVGRVKELLTLNRVYLYLYLFFGVQLPTYLSICVDVSPLATSYALYITHLNTEPIRRD